MREIWPVVIALLALVPASASADQCAWLERGLAEKARKAISAEEYVLFYCEHCGERPLRFRVESVELRPVPEYPFFEVRVNGELADLAYVYVRKSPGVWENLGLRLACGASDVSPSVAYELPDAGDEGRPPERIVREHEGPCPESCCEFPRWEAQTKAEAHAEPDPDAQVVGTVEPGHSVTALGARTHLNPVRAVVVHTIPGFAKGESFWILQTLGEGYARLWQHGRTFEADISGTSPYQLHLDNRQCRKPSNDCWARVEGEPWEIETFWAKARLPDGSVGWFIDAHRVFPGSLPCPE